MNWLGDLIQKYISKDNTVLDVGCGIIQALDGLKCKSYLGLDVWLQYLEQVKNRYSVIKMDVKNDLYQFLDNSFDVVVSLDLVEHLTQQEAWQVIYHTKRIARDKVIIFTPSKFETNDEAVKNAWGLGGCPYQKHQCLLTRQQFEENSFIMIETPDNALLAMWEKP